MERRKCQAVDRGLRRAREHGEGGEDFVPAPERIAVFDNDGTLWAEYPVPFQFAFIIDELARRAPAEPALAADPMVQAAFAGDRESSSRASTSTA